MPEYMLMIQEHEATERNLAPPDARALVDAQAAYEQTLRATGAHVDGERFRPSSEGRRVLGSGGEPRVEAGPFGDKALTGYYVVKTTGLEDAVTLAETCPVAPGGEIDVRPVMKGRFRPGRTSQQGRVFAVGILGNANTEPAWVDIMDRIDAATQEHPADPSLGGVRLHEPGRGRRVVAVGGRRAVFDGPFLESKEVIGGLCFLRMSDIDEAVAWARESAFLKHGGVEIRELWRS